MDCVNATSGNRTVVKGSQWKVSLWPGCPSDRLVRTDAGGQLGSHSCSLALFEPAGLVCFLMPEGHRAA